MATSPAVPLEDAAAYRLPKARPHKHTKLEWSNIKPVFVHLYIDYDLTLHEVKQKIEEEHGFCATDQMFKTRIRKWDISKNMKASQKDNVIEALLEGPATTQVNIHSHHKVVRRAKHRVKSGTLNIQSLDRIGRHNGIPETSRSYMQLNRIASPEPYHLARSLALPAGLAGTDLLLRAFKELVVSQGKNSTDTYDQSFHLVHEWYHAGVGYWQCNATASAQRAFTMAGKLTLAALHGPGISAHGILKYLSRYYKAVGPEVLHDQWRRYIIASVREALSVTHPLTIIVNNMQASLHDSHHELALWDCLLDTSQTFMLTPKLVRHWFGLAGLRMRLCLENRWHNALHRYLKEVPGILYNSDLMSPEWEANLLCYKAKLSSQEGNSNLARTYLQQVLTNDFTMLSARRELANLEDKCGNFRESLFHHEVVLAYLVEHQKSHEARALRTFQRILNFCKRWNLQADHARIRRHNPKLYIELEPPASLCSLDGAAGDLSIENSQAPSVLG